jgi:hypothetical protein
LPQGGNHGFERVVLVTDEKQHFHGCPLVQRCPLVEWNTAAPMRSGRWRGEEGQAVGEEVGSRVACASDALGNATSTKRVGQRRNNSCENGVCVREKGLGKLGLVLNASQVRAHCASMTRAETLGAPRARIATVTHAASPSKNHSRGVTSVVGALEALDALDASHIVAARLAVVRWLVLAKNMAAHARSESAGLCVVALRRKGEALLFEIAREQKGIQPTLEPLWGESRR